MKEVKLGHYAGPFFGQPPFENFMQSPIGLVPKAGGQTRLIFHLSYNFSESDKSFNFHTPDHLCSVKYNDLDHAVANCLKLLAKYPDITMIFIAVTTTAMSFSSYSG